MIFTLLEGYIRSIYESEICELIIYTLISKCLLLFICISHKDDLNNCKYILCTVPLKFQNLLVVNSSNTGLQNG